MAPFPFPAETAAVNSTTTASSAASSLFAAAPNPDNFQNIRSQWLNPTDILSILMICGGDIIRAAIAQLSGGRIVPVSFSFGWIAYSFSALLSAGGDGKLSPEPDFKARVINTDTKNTRDNTSWIIGRLLRDHRRHSGKAWQKPDIKAALVTAVAPVISRRMSVQTDFPCKDPTPAALEDGIPDEAADAKDSAYDRRVLEAVTSAPTLVDCRHRNFHVSFFETDRNKIAGAPDRDALWWCGIATAILQLIISIIPAALPHSLPTAQQSESFGVWGERDFSILMITALGILLAFFQGGLPQWLNEKLACRRLTKDKIKTVAITQGNGSRHAIVIRSREGDLDLEDLATGVDHCEPQPHTRIVMALFVFLWIALLVTVVGIRQNTWYLLVIGTIGMVQNALAASWPRSPSAHGLHLGPEQHFCESKVMPTLMKIDERYIGVGLGLVDTFFPGGLNDEEKKYWRRRARKLKLMKESLKNDKIGV